MILSSVGMLTGETIYPNEATEEHALGGLWNPAGPEESATTHIVRPYELLSSNPEPLPSAVDNSAGLPPVGNQFSQGSCTCWAIGYYHTTYIENRESAFNLTDPENQVSPGFLYHIANGGYDGGSYMEDVADLIITNGAPSMAEVPYNSGDDISWPAEDWIWVSGMKRRAVSQNWLDVSNSEGMDALRAHLAAGNTATIGISVWGNFDDIESYNNTYCSSERTGSDRGGHIVTICGYDDTMPTADGIGAFRMVNSWGTNWGDAGYWWMTPEAMVDGYLGYGMIMYMESELNYTPKLVAKARISHQERGDIVCNWGLSVSVIENGSFLADKPFLCCYWIEDWYVGEGYPVQQHPFPEGTMAFDISEFLPLMDLESVHDFQLTMNNAEGLSGELILFDILIPERWEGGICAQAPMTVEPYATSQANSWTYPGLYFHSPIRADGDAGMEHRAIGEFWQGNGTAGSPYLLHDYIIDGTGLGNCIYIGNTTLDFAISDCRLERASSADWIDFYGNSSVYLYFTTGGVLENNLLNASFLGMCLEGCGDLLIEENIISNNWLGMDMVACSNVTLCQNNITNSQEYGISLYGAINVTIYHNNIIGNPVPPYDDTSLNFWDDGYPSGGNYWGDYSGTDSLSGPGQDIPGSDGIGDTPYTNIEGGMGAQDNYPLMEPWGPTVDLSIAEGDITFSNPSPVPGEEITIGARIFNERQDMVTFDIPVKPDWNFISIPLVQDDTDPVAVLDDNGGDTTWSVAKWYDPNDPSDPWKTYRPGSSANDLLAVNHTIGIWLYVTDVGSDGYLTVKGRSPATTACQLFTGWNMMGFPGASDTQMTAGNVKALTGYKVTEIQTYLGNASGGMPSENYTTLADTDYLTKGKAYWFVVSDNCTWAVDNGFLAISDATATASFYLDSISEANLICRQENVIVPVYAYTTVSVNWTVTGNHTIIVDVTDVNPTDRNMLNNTAQKVLVTASMFNISLSLGWNLVSLPLAMADTSVVNVLSSISGTWDVAKYYDGATKAWKSYRLGGAQTFAAIDRTMGVWVHATGNCTLSVSGQEPTSTGITLFAGWNLVGYPSMAPRSVADALWGTSADRVEVFDPVSPYLISPVGPGYLMMPGEGYWVHVTADSVWTIDW